MIIPTGQDHRLFYNKNKYSGEKITSRYEGVFLDFYSPCCNETIISWAYKANGKKQNGFPFTEAGEKEAYEAYLKATRQVV